MIPIILKLKKGSQREIAKAQDLIIKTLFEVFNNAVIHGGTAIWRCYDGNRFSEDVDAYIEKDMKKIEKLFIEFEKNGFVIERRKIGNNSIYSNLRLDRILVRFEAVFKKIKGLLKEYENADGNFRTIYTLSAEELIKEKISAYLNRLKIRDLYDIFFLLRYADSPSIKKDLNKLISEFKKPIDENNLNILIIEGIVPKPKDMINYIRGKWWERKNI